MQMPKRIVLLGNRGFIGSHLEQALRPLAKEFIGFHVATLDLVASADALKEYFDTETAVVMTAGVKRQWGDSLEAFGQNVAMALNVARVLEKHPVRQFIYFSSAAVYGEANHDLHICEETPVRPTSYYGAAKFASECALRGCLALRPPLIYGPGDTSRSYGPTGFAWAAKQGEPVTLWGEGEEQREFIYVGDVVRLVVQLLCHPVTGPLNVASGRTYSFAEAAAIAGARTQFKPRTKPKVDHGFRNTYLTKLFPEFKFSGLHEGIRETMSALCGAQG
jgi:UDP-glucose 4-epimerase